MAYRFHLWALFFAFVFAGASLSQDRHQFHEYALKAAWLTNFIKFQDWPDGWVKDKLVIGILGEDPFEAAFLPVINRSFMGRKLVIKRIENHHDPALLLSCHLLFVAQSEEQRLDDIFDALEGSPVLVVGELENFAAPGRGDFNFLQSPDGVIYEMNPLNLENKGFRVRSTLLKYAEYLITEKGRRVSPKRWERRP